MSDDTTAPVTAEDLRERMNAALEDLLRRNGWDGERNEQVDRETAEILDTFMAVTEGELGRLRNRITAPEANGSELLARGERAERLAVSPERVDRALRVVLADLDYDLHKALERDEETGEDTYHETVAAFIAAYEEAE